MPAIFRLLNRTEPAQSKREPCGPRRDHPRARGWLAAWRFATLFGDVAPRRRWTRAPPDREERVPRRPIGCRRIRPDPPDCDAEIAARRNDDVLGRPRYRADPGRVPFPDHPSDILGAGDDGAVVGPAEIDRIRAAELDERRTKADFLGLVRKRTLGCVEARLHLGENRGV